MTKLVTASLYFHTTIIFFSPSSPILKSFFCFIETPFLTEGSQKVSQALTEVWKPGTNIKVASVPCFQLETSNG